MHYFALCTRDKCEEECDIESVFTDPPHPGDIVMMVKAYLCSNEWTQKPFVFIPFAVMEQLDGTWPEYNVPFKKMSDKYVAELKKTIDKVQAKPWNMFLGVNCHLYNWCEMLF